LYQRSCKTELSGMYANYEAGNYVSLFNLMAQYEQKLGLIDTYWYLRALTAKRLEKFSAAASYFNVAIAIAPENPNILRDISIFHREQGDYLLALEHASRLVKLFPDNAQNHSTLGLIYLKMNELENAEKCLNYAFCLSPTDAKVVNDLAKLKIEQGKYQDAINFLERNIKEIENNFEAICNLALAYRSVNQPNKACDLLSIPNSSQLASIDNRTKNQFLFNRSVTLLSVGRCNEGWIDYRKRFFAPEFTTSYRNYQFPRLERISDAVGKKLLIWPEQGVGDQFTFLSLLHKFQDVTKSKITLMCDPRLQTIYARSFSDVNVVVDLETSTDDRTFDFHLPLGDIAPLMNFSKDLSFMSAPYIKPKENICQNWNELLSKNKLRIGLAWDFANGNFSGSKQSKRKLNSSSLIDWIDIVENTEIQVVNLQYGLDANLMSDLDIQTFDKLYQPNFDLKNDFENLAALVGNLDCIISPVSAIMTFAASCGTPTLSYYTHVTDRALCENKENVWFRNAWFRNNKIFLFDEKTKHQMIQRISHEVETFLSNVS
jgi:ADP-heptose:LPS heptosyltransferase/thioredoxin-like negative regulator of GroEL